MSNKDLAIQLINQIPDYKLGYAIAYLQGLSADELADDMFCEQLYEEYQNDTSPDKNDSMSIEDFAKDK